MLSSVTFLLAIANIASAAVTAPAEIAIPANYLGCFKDAENRTLPEYTGSVLTADACNAVAYNAGAAYFGLQFWEGSGISSAAQTPGGECRYGNFTEQSYGEAYGNSTEQPYGEATGCVMTAGGMVGSSFENAVYAVRAPRNYLGCFKDAENRTLPEYTGSVMTADACKAAAQKAGAAYFGLQFWEGSGISSAAQTPGGECRYGNFTEQSYGEATGCVMTAGGMVGSSFENAVYSANSKETCTSNADCYDGLICLKLDDTLGVCGNADEEFDLLDNNAAEGHVRGRVLITDKIAWTNGTTVPHKVIVAHLLAPLARDAYKNPPQQTVLWTPSKGPIGANIKGIYGRWGWLSFTIYKQASSSLYVIAFKGTSPTRLKEVLTDLHATLGQCKIGATDCGKYHDGFRIAYHALRPKLLKALGDLKITATDRLYITGHSLGGALASLCALDMAFNGFSVHAVVTFGSPRIGNEQFETVYNNVMKQKEILQARFAATDSSKKHQDAVTMLPPVLRIPFMGKYSRPVENVIVGISNACDDSSLAPCEVRLHSMGGSYSPMIKKLYDIVVQANNIICYSSDKPKSIINPDSKISVYFHNTFSFPVELCRSDEQGEVSLYQALNPSSKTGEVPTYQGQIWSVRIPATTGSCTGVALTGYGSYATEGDKDLYRLMNKCPVNEQSS